MLRYGSLVTNGTAGGRKGFSAETGTREANKKKQRVVKGRVLGRADNGFMRR
jgi:hypothetical protein